MTHSKLDIDSILKQFRNGTEQMLGGRYLNNEPTLTQEEAKQALLEAFEQSLNTIIGENLVPGDWPPTDENWVLANKMIIRNELRNEQRNEAIKVIRGNDE